jgi:hypothetical protein
VSLCMLAGWPVPYTSNENRDCGRMIPCNQLHVLHYEDFGFVELGRFLRNYTSMVRRKAMNEVKGGTVLYELYRMLYSST